MEWFLAVIGVKNISFSTKRFLVAKVKFHFFSGFLLLGLVSVFMANTATAQIYKDIAKKQGLRVSYADSTTHIQNNYTFGSGVSFHDFNNDGFDDLSIPIGADSVLFSINDSSTFKDTNLLNLNTNGELRHVHWVDYDNDGDKELFLTISGDANKLYENNGGLNLVDSSSKAGLNSYTNNSMGVSWADYNRDGHLDFFVANYDFVSSKSRTQASNKLYRNNGDGTFTIANTISNIGDSLKPSFQGIWIDYNHDNHPDLYVINDLDAYANSLYRNDQDGTFTEVSVPTNANLKGHHPMSATHGDFDNDGLFDIYMGNSGINRGGLKREDILLKQMTKSSFKNKNNNYGISKNGWTWGGLWIDHDNNTFLDLHVTSAPVDTNNFKRVYKKNSFYTNQGGDSLAKGFQAFSKNPVTYSHAAAKGDFNNDGFGDIFVQGSKPNHSYFWKNAGNNNHYLKVSLTGTASNRMAIGSKITVFIDTNQYTKYTKSGQNYLSQNSQHKIFGLDTFSNVDSLSVEYPLGHEDWYYNLNVDTHYRLKEGETEEINLPDFKYLCKGDTVILSAGKYDSIIWNTTDTTSSVSFTKGGQYWVKAFTRFGILVRSDTITIKSYPDITSKVKDLNCFQDSNGRIALSLDTIGKPRLKEITWKGLTQKGKVVDSLSGGWYTYSYKDSNGCIYQDSVHVNEPSPLNLQTVVSYDTSKVDSIGVVNLNINGGTKPYQVYLDGKKTNKTIKDLPVDTYLVKVQDQNSCSVKKQVVLNYQNVPTIKAKKSQPSCYGANDGAIRLVIDTPPNTSPNIFWNNGKQGPVLKGLKAGSYIYRYTDNFGTKYKDTVELKGPSQIKINVSVAHRTPSNKGSLGFTISGGVPPYKVFLDGKQVSGKVNNLSAGNYQLRIKDSTGCTKSKSIKIKDKRVPSIGHQVENISCYGENDGFIQLIVNTPTNKPYQITWQDGKAGEKRRNIGAGTYIYQYSDSVGITYTDSVKVTEPDSLHADKKLKTEGNEQSCQVNINIKGGTKPYDIELDNKKRNNPIENVQDGYHTLYVKDSAGCELDTGVKIKDNFIPDIEPQVTNPSCHDSKDGFIELKLTPKPDSNYQINWQAGGSGKSIDSVGAGVYSYRYFNGSGCAYEDSVRVEAPYPIDIQKQVDDAKNDEYGSIKLVVNGGVPPYDIILDGAVSGKQIDSLKPGEYKIEVIDAKSCTKQITVTIDGPPSNISKSNEGKDFTLQPTIIKRGTPVSVNWRSSLPVNSLLVYNEFGKMVYKQGTDFKGKSRVNLKTSSLSPGVYIVKVLGETFYPFHERIVVVE